MRLARCFFWSLIAVLAFLPSAFAQNGLERFERDIKPQLEFEAFSYRSASPLGNAGFVLNDVTAIVPATPQTGGKPSTVKVDKVIVEEFDFERVPPRPLKGQPRSGRDDDVPRFAKIRLEGISGDDNIHNWLAPYGVPRVPVDASLDYRLDPAAKILGINRIELSLRGLARLELSAVLDGISDKASQIEGAKDEGRLRTGSLVLDDKGLLATLLPGIARSSGGSPDAYIAIVQASIQGFAAGQGPETLKALDAIASFVSDWRAPKGPIRFTVTPPNKVGTEDIDRILTPNALVDIFGLMITYDGTRPGAAGGGAAAPRERQPRRPPQEPVQRVTGKAAWDTVVGNTLTGRLGGKTFHEFFRPDGTYASLQDSEIIPGRWAIDGDKVCLQRNGLARTCYEVAAQGRTITLTDATGRGIRASLLRGNPRDL